MRYNRLQDFDLKQERKTHFTNIHFLEIREGTRKDKRNRSEIKCISFAYQELFRRSYPPYVGLVQGAASFASGVGYANKMFSGGAVSSEQFDCEASCTLEVRARRTRRGT